MKRIVFLSILIAVLAAFFASSNPDGLEKALGLISKDTATAPVSTAIAGTAGILLTFGLFWATAKVLRNK